MKHKIEIKKKLLKNISILFAIFLLLFSSIHLTGYVSSQHQNSMYDLLILTPDVYYNLLIPLVDHKEAMGVKTKLVSLSTVYDEMYWFGRDNPEKIKYFIKHAYDFWNIHFVLLVGDFRKMPVRYVYNNEPWPYYHEPRYISELYYVVR